MSNISKFFGWALLFIGILIISWTLFATYNIFTDKNPVPEIFKITDKQAETNFEKGKKLSTEEQMDKMMSEQIEKQLEKILPKEALIKLLNLISWSIMTGIFIFGGGKISDTGIKLIKV